MTVPSTTNGNTVTHSMTDRLIHTTNSVLQKRPRSERSSNRDRLTRDVLSRQTSTNESTVPAMLPVVPTVSPEQMYSNFEEWIKMATDNKINATNSWNFALIDYFHEMTFIRDGDSINFQRASCTLDGCVKIYTSRVDSVATETGKLLTGLADHTRDNGNEDNGGEGGQERRARRRANRSEVNLAKDFSVLAIKKLDVDFSVDPLFKKTSADFDEGGARGLLLNHLSLDQDCKIIFDSSDAITEEDREEDTNIMDLFKEKESDSAIGNEADSNDVNLDNVDDQDSHEDNDSQHMDMDNDELTHEITTEQRTYEEAKTTQAYIEISSLKAKLPLHDMQVFEDLKICPTLYDINFFTDDIIKVPGLDDKDDDVDMADDVNKNMTGSEDQQRGDDNQEDNQFDYGYDDTAFDDYDAGEEDNDQANEDGIMDPFADNDATQIADEHGFEDDQNDHIDTMSRSEINYTEPSNESNTISNQQENELLSYFDNSLSKNWAGPAHWKLRNVKTIPVHLRSNGDDAQNETATANTTSTENADHVTNSVDTPGVNKTSKRRSNPRKMIDFFEDDDLDHSIFNLSYKPKKGVKEGYEDETRNNVLPNDEHFSSKQLLRYFLKPVVLTIRYKGKQVNAGNEQTTSLDTENNELVNDAFPDFDIEQGSGADFWANAEIHTEDTETRDNKQRDDDEHSIGDTRTQFDDVSLLQDSFIDSFDYTETDISPMYGDQLITNHQVKRTKPLYVNYARTAKRVDVKKLKENLWKVLTIDPNNGGRSDTEGKVHGERKFTDVLKGLKKLYPPKVMKDISVPFCFICLLHLANEQNLAITGPTFDGNGNDSDDDYFVLGGDASWTSDEKLLHEVKIVQVI